MGQPKGPTIGILSPYLENNFYGALVSGVHRVVSAVGGRVVAISTSMLGKDDRRQLLGGRMPPVSWAQVAGFVSITRSVEPAYVHALSGAGKPLVVLSHDEPGYGAAVVLADNRGGVRQAVEHLLGHGHTRIAFAGCLDHFDARQRYASYRDTLLANGLEPDPDLFFELGDNLESGGREAARRIVEAGVPCTAAITGCDMNAAGLMAAMKEAGWRLPRDLAVIGFDDMPLVSLVSPRLTTVSHPFGPMGARAGQLLLSLLRGDAVERGPHVVEAPLVVRDSCGCATRLRFAGGGGRGREPGKGPVATLVDALRMAWTGSGEPGLENFLARAAQLGEGVESTFGRATAGEISELDLLDLGQMCQELYSLMPGEPTRAAVAVLARDLRWICSGSSGSGGERSAGVLVRLEQCVSEVRMALSRAQLPELSKSYLGARLALREERKISLDLLRGHHKDPAALEWVGRTDALAAVLALWRSQDAGALRPGPDGNGATGGNGALGGNGATGLPADGELGSAGLDVVGTFNAGGPALPLSAEAFTAQEFPPPVLLGMAGPESLVAVFPVGSDDQDRGLLAVVLSTRGGNLMHDRVFAWEGLLAEALDYRDVLDALRDQREQLERAYGRERKMAQAVKESEERYALAARAANDGLWDWDLVTGIVFYSARWKRMLGYAQGAVGETPQEWLDRVHPEDKAPLMASIEALQVGHRTSLSSEHRIMAADGTYRWVLCRALAVPGRGQPAKRVVGFVTDIEDQRSLQERLRYQAFHDELTDLPNRTLFVERLSLALSGAKRRRRNGYVVFWLDLDGFKVLNDSLGHLTCVRLVVMVADRIRLHVRETDTAARFGGDEFALLLHGIPDSASIRSVARRLLAHLNEPYDLGDRRVVITASLGIATSLPVYKRPEEVLRDADIAMYRAKAGGPGGFVVFDSAMYEGAMVRMETETRLRQALDMGQLELHYQPVVYLHNRQIVGFEALVRWRHPVAGLVPPLKFIPVAEESGLIVPLGNWVRQEAWRQLASWQAAGLLDQTARLGVNLSNREFWDPQLVEGLETALARAGARPQSALIEITEGVIMQDLEQAVRVLQRLHDLGVQTSIDDFGTGYSSLQALHRLPIQALKMDRSFVSGLWGNKRTVELARTIVQMGSNLGLRVIAEGIETATEADVLMKLKCHLGQGYFYYRPMPADEATALLATQAATGYGTLPPQR